MEQEKQQHKADTSIPSYILDELENTSKIFRIPLHFLKDIYVLGLLQGTMRGRREAAADFNAILGGQNDARNY